MSTTTAVDPTVRARDLLGVSRLTNQALTGWLHGLPGVDQVGAEARAATLGSRSIKTTAKAWAIDLAIRMIDLTTLEGADTPGKVKALCGKAKHPDSADPSCPKVAAICVYGDMVPTAVAELAGSGIHVASVATAFGQYLGSDTALRRLVAPLARIGGAGFSAGTSDFLDLQRRWAGCADGGCASRATTSSMAMMS